jgi:hypothetical protein
MEYVDFVDSQAWDKQLEVIASIDANVAQAVEAFGIGTNLNADGSYDFESGQLLEDFPEELKISDAAYDAIVDLANQYAEFCG